jgi:hypothetical protein
MQTDRQTLIKVTVGISRVWEDAAQWLSYTDLVCSNAVMRVVRIKTVCPLYWCNDCPDADGRLSRSWTPHVSAPTLSPARLTEALLAAGRRNRFCVHRNPSTAVTNFCVLHGLDSRGREVLLEAAVRESS